MQVGLPDHPLAPQNPLVHPQVGPQCHAVPDARGQGSEAAGEAAHRGACRVLAISPGDNRDPGHSHLLLRAQQAAVHTRSVPAVEMHVGREEPSCCRL